MDPTGLTYEKMISKLSQVVGDSNSLSNLIIRGDENNHQHVGIVNRLCTSFRLRSLEKTKSDVSFSFLVFNLLVMLRFDSGVS
ncbi:unnamed protein product [Hymenolepis diminuta]|uniref:Uncharacterized protein n=1 Tax=Hymenolepis diminuta TaxID=6216 RepID=A0A564Z3H5_HYMDI|nr:unnamed protein product [Hymenolepis diminuta]